VLVTALEQRTLPLIRYELTDRVVLSPEPNPAGRPFAVVAGVQGRSADTLVFEGPGGEPVRVLPARLIAPVAHLPGLREYQLVRERDALEVRLALEGGLPSGVEQAVRRAIEAAGATPPPIRVVPLRELEREAGGAAKLKLVIDRTADS
jgi:phenylacetate-coenzyme A ligase PaaK-like adenylate-forming protein